MNNLSFRSQKPSTCLCETEQHDGRIDSYQSIEVPNGIAKSRNKANVHGYDCDETHAGYESMCQWCMVAFHSENIQIDGS